MLCCGACYCMAHQVCGVERVQWVLPCPQTISNHHHPDPGAAPRAVGLLLSPRYDGGSTVQHCCCYFSCYPPGMMVAALHNIAAAYFPVIHQV
jgi:hypothetical protein